MNAEDLEVEKVRSYPEWSAFFLEKCAIYIQIRNKSDRSIQIEKVECKFQCEDSIEPYVPNITPYMTLQPGHLSRPIRVEFEADLALRTGTNNYRIIIQYRDDILKIFEHDPRKFLIFSSLSPGEENFFISHKDPEDTDIGRQLAHFLKKLGFAGYLSEDDYRPGVDLWMEKIPVAIESSIGVIILWTSRAAKNPDNIYREINIAKSMGKRLIMAREEWITAPDIFPKEIEYYRFKENPISMADLKKLACTIEDTYRRGGYSKKGCDKPI